MENLEKLQSHIREKMNHTPEVRGCVEIYNPINLNHVLQWLGIDYMVNGIGTICKWDEYQWVYDPKCRWDLNNPFLSSQDESVIDYLASLI